MGQIVQTLVNGATYAGSLQHSIINYALLFITFLPHLIGRTQIAKNNRSKWFCTLLSATLVQISIWFFIDAVGISLVWSALAGFNLLLFLRSKGSLAYSKRLFFLSSFVIIFFAIIYYLIILPVITTIAHVAAILMGIGFYRLYKGQ